MKAFIRLILFCKFATAIQHFLLLLQKKTLAKEKEPEGISISPQTPLNRPEKPLRFFWIFPAIAENPMRIRTAQFFIRRTHQTHPSTLCSPIFSLAREKIGPPEARQKRPRRNESLQARLLILCARFFLSKPQTEFAVWVFPCRSATTSQSRLRRASIPTPFVPSGHFPLIGGIGPWKGSQGVRTVGDIQQLQICSNVSVSASLSQFPFQGSLEPRLWQKT